MFVAIFFWINFVKWVFLLLKVFSSSFPFFSFSLLTPLLVGGFSCWERYFSCVNSLEQRAREWLDPKNFIVLDLELLGMEFLWAACFGCDDEVVFGCVLGRLMSLHRQLGPQLMERFVCFILRCLFYSFYFCIFN